MGEATHNVNTVADRTFLQYLLLSGGKRVGCHVASKKPKNAHEF